MNRLYRFGRFLFGVLFCAAASLSAESGSAAYDVLQKTYATTLNGAAPEKELSLLTREINSYRRYSLLTGDILKPYELAQEEKEGVVYSGRIDRQFLNDLELFSSKGLVAVQGAHDENKPRCIADSFDRTRTMLGRVALHRILIDTSAGVSPTVSAIEVRQNATRVLAEDSELFSRIDKLCSSISDSEQSVLMLWEKHEGREKYLFSKEPVELLLTNTAFFASLLTSCLLYGAVSRKDDSAPVNMLKSGGAICVFVMMAKQLYSFVPALYERVKRSGALTTAALRIYAAAVGMKIVGECGAVKKVYNVASLGGKFDQSLLYPVMVTGCFPVIEVFLVQNTIQVSNALYHAITPLLKDWSVFLKSAEKMTKLTSATPELSALMGQQRFASFACLTDKNHPLFEKLQYIQTLLASRAVQNPGPLAILTDPIGDAFAAYILLDEIKSELAPLIEAVGVIDAYRSAAQIFTESASVTLRGSESNCYSFVTFIDDELPRFDAHNLWNPLVGRERAVPSDFALGGELVAKNALVSGPNAGGKSTTLRAIMTSVLCAQGFGVAPAQSLVMTPFTHLITYFDILDSTADENSHFITEMLRAKQLTDVIQNLQPNERALVMVDELFRGTEGAVAASLSKALLKHLGSYDRSMLVLASHFRATTGLEVETKGRFKNFHVSAFVNPIKYPYKLSEGPTTQNIAFNLLEENGFNTYGVVNDAREYYKQIAPTGTA